MIPFPRAFLLGLTLLLAVEIPVVVQADDDEQLPNNMVKMCLFYDYPSAHARSDPIINQECASDHVHTFYGPQTVHPDTTYEELRDTPPQFSTSPFEENQSLYWHPSIFRVDTTEPADDGSSSGSTNETTTTTYTRIDTLESSPYYRWDNGNPTVAFPPGFRMIAHSSDPGANQGGENGFNLFTECCDLRNGDDECEFRNELWFPNKRCSFHLGIGFSMPTCWDGVHLGNETSGPGSDHKSHMAYTTNGKVNGPCPAGFPKRVPQVQLFLRVPDYQGGTYSYMLADGTRSGGVFHVDFFNGWKEGKLQEVIDHCEPNDGPYDSSDEYNPPCDCDQFLTESENPAQGYVCDADIRRFVLNEPTKLLVDEPPPRGTCQLTELVPKSWDRDEYPTFNTCGALDEDEDEDDELPLGAIIGGTAGALTLFVVGLALARYFVRRSSSGEMKVATEEDLDADTAGKTASPPKASSSAVKEEHISPGIF